MIAAGSMIGVVSALAALPLRGRGRTVMIMAAKRGEGTSGVARAVTDAFSAGVTLLLDLDLARSDQRRAFAEAGSTLSDGIDGRLKGQALYRIVDAQGRPKPEPQNALAYYRVGRSKLFVSGFAPDALQGGDRLQFPLSPAYWNAVRESCELCVVDAPALEQSRVGLSVCAHMDAVVLVASGADGSVTASVRLKSELEAAGAFVMGVVYTRADKGAFALERPALG